MDLRHSQNAVVARAVSQAATANHTRSRVSSAASHSGAINTLRNPDSIVEEELGAPAEALRCGVQAIEDAVLGP
jgi:hypothetical protein